MSPAACEAVAFCGEGSIENAEALVFACENAASVVSSSTPFPLAEVEPQDESAGKTVLLIVGSPRRRGVSARYADALAAQLEAEGVRVVRWSVAEHGVRGCTGCEACRGGSYSCVIQDDMQELYGLLDAVDEAALVAPVYFAGPTAQLKCVLDRLQPYWERRRGPAAEPGAADAPKRSVALHVIGAGGDPFGYDPMIAIVRSAFGAAGWRVASVVGRIGWGQPEHES